MGFTLTPEACSWSHVEMTLDDINLSLPTIRKIEYGSKNNTVAVYGAGNKMYDRTAGIIEVDAVKIEIGVSDWATLFTALVAYGQLQPKNIAAGIFFTGNNGMDIIYAPGTRFGVSVQFSLIGNLLVFSDSISDCQITAVNMSPAQGPDPVMVSIEMQCQDVQRSVI